MTNQSSDEDDMPSLPQVERQRNVDLGLTTITEDCFPKDVGATIDDVDSSWQDSISQ